jgi:hypothetical protein
MNSRKEAVVEHTDSDSIMSRERGGTELYIIELGK